MPEDSPIYFYETSDEFGCFANFSPHPIRLKGKLWPTSEHYFQAQKFAGTPREEAIRRVKRPNIAFRMGNDRRTARPAKGWERKRDQVMREALHAKLTQHPELRELLLSTGDRKIVEHTDRDAYWGDGGNGTGKNRLGQLLMEERAQLRAEAPQLRQKPTPHRSPGASAPDLYGRAARDLRVRGATR